MAFLYFIFLLGVFAEPKNFRSKLLAAHHAEGEILARSPAAPTDFLSLSLIGIYHTSERYSSQADHFNRLRVHQIRTQAEEIRKFFKYRNHNLKKETWPGSVKII